MITDDELDLAARRMIPLLSLCASVADHLNIPPPPVARPAKFHGGKLQCQVCDKPLSDHSLARICP